jgi:hypothetical protein
MKKLLLSLALLALLSSCTVSRNSMREANYQLWLHHEDLEFSPQVVGEAKQTKVLLVDWNRLFGRKWEFGQFGSLPNDPFSPQLNGNVAGSGTPANAAINFVVNGIIGINNVSRVEQMAMYDLMRKNPGYDMIIFPQFEARRKWFVFGSRTHVMVKARLAKLKATQ